MENSLAHHGVKGMKLGVRRQKKYQMAANKARLMRDKANTWQKKADSGSIAGKAGNFFVGRHDLGRSIAIQRKADHRKAKIDYANNKTAANKAKLGKARMERLINNYGGRVVGRSSWRSGSYKTYRDSGASKVKSVLKVAGFVAVSSIV